MTRFLILFSFIVFFSSCNNDDDNNNNNDEFFQSELTKDFLLNEKWFLNSVSSESGNDLLSNVPDCDLDSFYIFDQFNENRVVLNDGEIQCEDFDSRYAVSDYMPNIETQTMNFSTAPLELLGGFKGVLIFTNVEFLVSRDSSFKLIKANIRTNTDGAIEIINYSLISRADNRP